MCLLGFICGCCFEGKHVAINYHMLLICVNKTKFSKECLSGDHMEALAHAQEALAHVLS